MQRQQQVLVLGIGNVLWADEGFGVRAVEVLDSLYEFPANVQLMDGGTQGLYLVNHVTDATHLLVFDAIDYGLPPGTLKRVQGAEVPRFMGAKKMSLHQTGFQEVLAAAELLGKLPAHLALVGIQPEELDDYGGSLRPQVREQLPAALETGLEILTEWGIHVAQREIFAAGLGMPELALERYEADRPPAELAYRHGDIRFIPHIKH